MRLDSNSPEFKTAISVERMRKSDMYTIKKGVSGRELMHRAAMGIFDSAKWSGKKVAIICGSGINGDTGESVIAVKSDLTVSIGHLKTGMFLNAAPEFIGKLVNVDIGIELV